MDAPFMAHTYSVSVPIFGSELGSSSRLSYPGTKKDPKLETS